MKFYQYLWAQYVEIRALARASGKYYQFCS